MRGSKTAVTMMFIRDSDDVVKMLSRAPGRCKLIDITGKVARAVKEVGSCHVKFIHVKDTAGFIDGILKEILPEDRGEFEVIYLYGLSPFWALAYDEFGIAYHASAIFLMLVYLSFVTRIYGRRLAILIEDWLHRKHRFIYEVARCVSDGFATPP